MKRSHLITAAVLAAGLLAAVSGAGSPGRCSLDAVRSGVSDGRL
jgi:hypothetical protein